MHAERVGRDAARVMRNVIVPLSAGAAPPRGHTASLHPSVVAFSALAAGCFPLGDLSAYSSGFNNAGGAGEQPMQPDPGEGGGANAIPPLTSGGGTTSQENPGDDTPLDPDAPATAGSGNVMSGGMCTGDCPGADAGATADAAPPRPEAGPPEEPAPLGCALGEQTGPNGRCYMAVATLLSWDAARTSCQGRGAGWDLATIRTSIDSVFIRSLLTHEVWVGGADDVTEETWAWVTDGFAFWQGEGAQGSALNGAFVNWFDDEPNGGGTSDCLRLLLDSLWADLECTELRGSLCEGPPS